MKLYMKGTASVPQEDFIPDDLFLGTREAEATDEVSEEVIRLYSYNFNTGYEAYSEGNEWEIEWDELGLETAGGDLETEFTLDQLKSIIVGNGLRIVNMITSFDGDDTLIKVTECTITDYSKDKDNPEQFSLTEEQLGEAIEFIS